MYRVFCASCLKLNKLGIQRVGQPGHNFVLHIEQIGNRLVEAFSPKLNASFSVDQLYIYPKPFAAALHGSAKRVTNVQLAADLPEVDGFILVREGGMSADHEQTTNARQVSGQTLSHAIHEVLLLRVAAQVGERKHDNGQTRRRIWGRLRVATVRGRANRLYCEPLRFLHCTYEAETFARQSFY